MSKTEDYQYGFQKGKQETINQVKKIINNLETQYPDDDGKPFEELACNFKNELIRELEKIK